MQHSRAGSSGASGAARPAIHFTPISTADLPEQPQIPQKVKFFTARTTFIAGSSLEEISAIDFDAVMLQLFGEIADIDREQWSLADRLYALNTALAQQAERRDNGQPYIRLDSVPDGLLQLSIIEPPEPDEAEESAIQSATNGDN